MISYRFKRRSFLTAMSGGLGLKIMLRNFEAKAQGMKSPPRLLVTHWPVGIVAGSGDALWKPTTGSVGGSPVLKPFADAGLANDMTVFRGISTANLNTAGGGSHEQGTVSLVTGLSAGGTRANCCEGDDAFAAPGGSFEQILLKNVSALQRPGNGYANSIADSRTDYAEISTQCLSYSTSTESVTKYNNAGTANEAIPLKPTLSALAQFNNLFGNFIPGGITCGTTISTGSGSGGSTTGSGGRSGSAGGSGNGNADAILKGMAMRKNVLDFCIEELNQLKAMAPSDAKNLLQIHTDEITKAQGSVASMINSRYPGTMGGTGGAQGTGGRNGGGTGGSNGGTGGSGGNPVGDACTSKPTSPPNTQGGMDPNNGRGTGNNYGNDGASKDDSMDHQVAGKAHLDVLKAAFVCDLIRVGTYQWSPGTNHVGFKLYPNSTGVFQHHPLSHRIGTAQTTTGAAPGDLQNDAEFLYNVQLWYFSRHAENIAAWKSTIDGCGNSLLDFTVIPFVTEVMATGHERSNMAAMLFGGSALGFTHGTYKTGSMSINSYWGTIGQAFGYTGGGVFGTPVSGLWTKPA